MENHIGAVQDGQHPDEHIASQDGAGVRVTRPPRARPAKAWLEYRRNLKRPGAGNKDGFPFGRRDNRKWDYRNLGYADKPYTPRDYSKPISAELEAYYGEFKSKGL